MVSSEYDVVIIGAGPGGYVAAVRAAQLGLSVGLVEREHLGGVCLNWGCIPTKALLRSAEVARLVTTGGKEFGFEAQNVSLDFGSAVDRSRKISARLVKGVEALMKGNGVDVIWGQGRLVAADGAGVEIEVADVENATSEPQRLKAGAVILATGARARSIPGVEIDGERVLTYRAALARRELPESAVIIGAGPIGLEFATVWNAYGTDVRVVEMLDHALPSEDEEAAAELNRYLRRQKIKVLASTRVDSIATTDTGVRVHVTGPKKEEDLEADVALIAIGVRPNSEDLGLEAVGVETQRGWVTVDDRMRTNVPNVYAIGDLNGTLPLAHVASAQGILAVEMIAGQNPAPFDAHFVPRGTYTSPQVASFGLSEAAARQQLAEVAVGTFPFLPNGKALALGENVGFVKIIADAASHEIVGAVIVGPEATEILPELVLAARSELTPDEIARTVHAHPTLNEAVMEAAHAVFGHALHAV